MNRNEDRRLTPKQEELVKRLEQIRQSKKQNSQTKEPEAVPNQTKQRKGHNADVQQRGQKNSPKERPKESIFSQEKKTQTIKRPRRDYTALRKKKEAAEKEKRRARQKRKKNSSKLTDQLAKGQSLAQAIALSEILDKPVSLRRNRR